MQSESYLGNNNATSILASDWDNYSLKVIMEIYYPNIHLIIQSKILLSLFYFQHIIYLVSIKIFCLNNYVRVYVFL